MSNTIVVHNEAKKELNNLDLSQRNKIVKQISYLCEFGLSRDIPNNRKVTGTKFWELRVLGKDNLRAIYASLSPSSYIILSVFHKKTQKTSIQEIKLSTSRLNSY